MNKKFKEIAAQLGLFLGGAAGHHYVSKILDRPAEQESAELEAIRDKKLKEVSQNLADIKKNVSDIKKQIIDPDKVGESSNIPDNVKKGIKECADRIEETSESVSNMLDGVRIPFEQKDIIVGNMKGIEQYCKDLKSFLDSIDKDSFVSWLDKFYAYLDSLTLFQESAVVHILLFIVLLLTVFNIFYVFFGNEIITYFKLEQRFPSLSGLIRLRAKFQRYYLMWNIFILFLVCGFGIFVNILVLIKVH